MAVERFHTPLSYSEELWAAAIFYIVIFIVFAFFVRFVDRSTFSEIGFTPKNASRAIGLGFTASAGYIVLVPFFGIRPIRPFSMIPLLVLASFMVGLTEEAFFRGYIQRKMKMVHGDVSAIVYTAVLFAAAHIPKYLASYEDGFFFVTASVEAVRSIIMLGALFGFLHETVKNLWCVVTAHTTWDLYLMLFPPTFLDYSSLLIFLTLSTFSTSITLGLSIILALETTKAPIVLPSGPPPERAQKEAEALASSYTSTERIADIETPYPSGSSGLNEFRFCPHCGGPLSEIFLYCPHCGEILPLLPPPPQKALVSHLWPNLQAEVTKTDIDTQRLYEGLVGLYAAMYGGGKPILDKDIEAYLKLGLTREEAIRRLAKEKGITR